MPTLDQMEEVLQAVRSEQAASTVQIKSLQHQISGALKRIDEQARLVESVHELATSVKLQAQALEGTRTEVGRLRDDVDELKDKPAKRWESVIGAALAGIVAAVIGYVCGRVGLM